MIKYIAPIVFLFGVCSGSYSSYGTNGIDAAIHSKHSVQTLPVSSSKAMVHSPVIDINGSPLPLTLRFNSHSSRILSIQKHFSNKGQVQKQNAIDEPDLLVQNIRKPVIQEVREVISPFRQITQEIRPVREQIETLIARGQDGLSNGAAGFGAGSLEKYGSPKYSSESKEY